MHPSEPYLFFTCLMPDDLTRQSGNSEWVKIFLPLFWSFCLIVAYAVNTITHLSVSK